MRNIKLKNWHDNNMEKMKILLEKCTKRKKSTKYVNIVENNFYIIT